MQGCDQGIRVPKYCYGKHACSGFGKQLLSVLVGGRWASCDWRAWPVSVCLLLFATGTKATGILHRRRQCVCIAIQWRTELHHAIGEVALTNLTRNPSNSYVHASGERRQTSFPEPVYGRRAAPNLQRPSHQTYPRDVSQSRDLHYGCTTSVMNAIIIASRQTRRDRSTKRMPSP